MLLILFGTLVALVNSEAPVCIIGAGLSGLTLGNLLQEKGHNVILFERFDHVGGKMEMFRRGDDIQVSIGPVYFHQAHENMLRYAEKYGMTPIPFNDSYVATFEPYTGAVLQGRQILNLVRPILLEAIQSYGVIQAAYIRNKNLDFGYTKAAQRPELFLSMSEWLEQNNLYILKPVFRAILTQQGYGAVETTAALYALKMIDWTMLSAQSTANSNGPALILQEGYDVLAQRMAATLSIKLGHEVTDIYRSSHGQLVKTKRVPGGQIETFKCHKTVVAFPPINLNKIVKDLTQREENILGQVKGHKYAAGVHHIPNWDQSVYGSVGALVDPKYFRHFMGNGNVILFAKQSFKKMKHLYSSYSWINGDYTEVCNWRDLDLMERRLQWTLKRISKGRGRSLMKIQQTHAYMPHVNTTSLKQGFYEQFDKIQGSRGLFYLTTLLGFEIMESAIEISENFAAKYFQ